ncbi:MAG: universal stress protein [Flavipsychrobacter sp.]|nr:universal stress protein [Flavipsychrobacter sp.]
MKKILFVFDGKHFSNGAFEFIRHLNSLKRVMVTGVFLPALEDTEFVYSFDNMSGPYYVSELPHEEDQTEKSIFYFESLCRQNDIEYKVHSGFTTEVVAELKAESRYADLMVIGSKLFYENLDAETQEDYIEKILHKAECPVLLAPETYSKPENIVLAYDGSDSSVYAIKQFAYLFPEYQDLQTLLVYTDTSTKNIPDKDNIQELACHHFNDLVVFKLKLDRGKEFEQWLFTNKHAILIAGAYGRSLFSEMLHKSFVKEAIQDNHMPVFVTHK